VRNGVLSALLSSVMHVCCVVS